LFAVLLSGRCWLMFEWCCRCQTADWKKHKKICITPIDRKLRIQDLVLTQMVDAFDRWDSARVISLGAQAEADLLIIYFPLKEKVEGELLEMMARAFARTAQYSTSLEYFERLLLLFDPKEKYNEHTRTQIRIADMHVSLNQFDKAKVIYTNVHAIGERDGNFEFHSKSCLGLCRVEKEAGNKTRAIEFAHQALIAADLLLDGEYSKARDQAQAIIEIINFSDMKSEEFDETLLTRLDELTTAVDANEEGGSSLCVKSADLQWRRHWYMSRWLECANACAKVMRLANQSRFRQTQDVQSISVEANQIIETLYGLGLIAMNPER
jgi:tetratricopeptide (TPR) repeat protein